jgi:tetratricopeptide (TPR) repeat protein
LKKLREGSEDIMVPNVKELVNAERFDEAVEELVRLEKERALSLPELVAKGELIQLGSATISHDLDEARRSFQDALDIDESYVPALIELAFFHYAVEDDSQQALPLFEKAVEICIRQLTEAVEGKMKCIEELHSAEAARSFLVEIARRCLDLESLEKRIDE